MGRGDRGPSRGGQRQCSVSGPHGEPSPQGLASEAEQLQQQGERRKGTEAAAKYEAAAAKYQQALDAVLRQRLGFGATPGTHAGTRAGPAGPARGGAVSIEEAAEMRAGLAECYQLLSEAILAAAAAAPDAQLTAETERQAAATAMQHLITAVGHYASSHPAAALTPSPPGPQPGGGAAATAAAASAAATAASTAAAALEPDVAVNAGNCLAALGEQLEDEAGRLAAAVAEPATAAAAAVAVAGAPSVPAGLAEALALYDGALRCYRSASACYQTALAREEDALTLANLGDVLVQSGTCLYGVARAVREAPPAAAAAALAAQGSAPVPPPAAADPASAAAAAASAAAAEWAAAREAEAGSDFTSALSAYERACSLSDSSQGDDLPGLLCNWGAGLLSMAGCLRDPSAWLPLLQQAAGRLEHAASFDRADPAPLTSLGDVLAAAGEAAEELAKAALATAGAAQGAAEAAEAAAQAAHWVSAARAHLQGALERGYGAALRLRSDEPEALGGCGEAHLALARLARLEAAAAAAAAAVATGSGGDPAAAAAAAAAASAAAEAAPATAVSHAHSAAAALQSALSRPERLGGAAQRCDVRYNAACALALAGREQEAQSLFSSLLAAGRLRVSELAADADLAALRGTPWMEQLMAAAAAAGPGPAAS